MNTLTSATTSTSSAGGHEANNGAQAALLTAIPFAVRLYFVMRVTFLNQFPGNW